MPAERPSPELPRWRVVENVVAAIERVRRTLPGVVVRQNVGFPTRRNPGVTRNVDVLVTIPTQGRELTMASR